MASTFTGRISASGEGQWALQAAIDESVTAAVPFTRLASRGEADHADRIP
jgi:6-phosphogluconate dehydrogenase (decarboxylating)